VRSIRYPGIISWKTKPGGGTTDYAIDIYFKALKEGAYECFLSENTRLPMMYMNDAVAATIQLMQATPTDVKLRTGYNLGAIDFTPNEMALEIKKHLPDFKISYHPDFRQEIAASWPSSIDDSAARTDWNWQHKFDLSAITIEMLKNIKTESIV
jgi:nucleoside-diphosphate-sugar epimerase